MSLRIERLGSLIDVIVGKRSGSVSLREFYSFQDRWDELNESFGLRMSGALWLSDPQGKGRHPTTWECYRFGRRVLGDNIGRPQRQSLAALRAGKPEEQRSRA